MSASDITFEVLEDGSVTKVEIKDARTPEKQEIPVTSVPKTGDDPWKPLLLLAICGLSAAALVVTTVRKRKLKKKEEMGKTNEKTAMQAQYPDIQCRLTIPGTNVDYPVLQSGEDEPEYYLKRNYRGSEMQTAACYSSGTEPKAD